MTTNYKPDSPIITTCESDFDIAQFNLTKKILGVGGFGIVQLVERCKGNGESELFAMKASSKESVLKRPNGVNSVMSELRCLILLQEQAFICNIQYAFQDARYLFLVLELVEGGDMRTTMRTMENCRFSEAIVKFYACQIILAINSCHVSGILHRGIVACNSF